MTYALLIYRSLPPSVTLPEAVERAALASHRALQQEAASRGQLHAVARLDSVSEARTVRLGEGAHAVTDGPYAETKEWLVGFYVIECDGQEHALARARQICPDAGHLVEVRPVNWRWTP